MLFNKYRNKTGIFLPKHPEKYMGKIQPKFKSILEKNFMEYVDKNPLILKWAYEPMPIPYTDLTSGGKTRRYFVDFVIITEENGIKKTKWIEIKSKGETVPPKNKKDTSAIITWIKNNCKWSAARAAAKKKGYEFFIITEDQLR